MIELDRGIVRQIDSAVTRGDLIADLHDEQLANGTAAWRIAEGGDADLAIKIEERMGELQRLEAELLFPERVDEINRFCMSPKQRKAGE